MLKQPKFIIASAIALYALALAIAWQQVDARAEHRIRVMLESAERGYSDVIDGEIDAALRYVGGALVNFLGSTEQPQSLERMQELAKTFNLDEINIIDNQGRAIGSNIPAVLGFDFNSHPLTREFMVLTNANRSIVSQPFRAGVANPEMFCKYYGMRFPGHGGFLQLGLTVDRLRQNMYSYTALEADQILRDWHFSVEGWYERVPDGAPFLPSQIIHRWSASRHEYLVGRYFDYRGYRYIAYLPESYCYAQRNAAFAMTALVLALVLFFFTYVLVRLAKASSNLAARTAADLALARTIQMSALPSTQGAFLDQLEFSLAAECSPAREVGGDFYDFFPISGGRLALLVADVSGKGIPGALFMMETKNILKNCLTAYADLAEAVTEANIRICERNQAELFVTAWIGALNPNTGSIEFVNAGHNRPLVRRSSGAIEKVMGKGGRFLGMWPELHYRAHELTLAKGDLLYLYTDGVTEAMNATGEQFGEKRLREALTGFNREVGNALAEFVGAAERSDDLTNLMLYWAGAPATSEKTFPAKESSLGEAVEFIRMALAGVEAKAIASLLNAADEITSNIVNYAEATEFSIRIERGYDRARLVFSDNGLAYNPLSHVDPDTHATIEERPIGGLGLVVVKRLVDRVTYVRDVENRNNLSLIKRIR